LKICSFHTYLVIYLRSSSYSIFNLFVVQVRRYAHKSSCSEGTLHSRTYITVLATYRTYVAVVLFSVSTLLPSYFPSLLPVCFSVQKDGGKKGAAAVAVPAVSAAEQVPCVCVCVCVCLSNPSHSNTPFPLVLFPSHTHTH
jgi:hypothetical protein